MYIRLLKKQFLCKYRDLPLGPSDMFFRGFILMGTFLLRGGGACTQGAFDGEEGTRWDAGVGVGGVQPGSCARKGRSLAVDQPCATRNFPGGEGRHGTCR
jgi:hypothetical protein